MVDVQGVVRAAYSRPDACVRCDAVCGQDRTHMGQRQRVRALHLLVDVSTGMPVYYANPYGSCRPGGNENRNGMIRRYLPKGTSLDDLTQDELDEITRRINNTPLKVLGWLTPAEAWDEQMERLAAKGTTVPGYPVQSTPNHNPRQCCTSN